MVRRVVDPYSVRGVFQDVTAELDFLSQSWKTESLDAIICLAKLRITGDAKQLEGKVTFGDDCECWW